MRLACNRPARSGSPGRPHGRTRIRCSRTTSCRRQRRPRERQCRQRDLGVRRGKLETEGRAYGVSASTFEVNGLRIQIKGVTPRGGSLVDGAKVEVEFTRAGGQHLAQKIAVER